MTRKLPAALVLALGLASLAGCVPPQPAPPGVALAPPPPPPVAVAAVVPAPPAPPGTLPPKRHPVSATHPAHPVVHHGVRHYVHVVRRTRVGTPPCGSVVHPCTVEHLAAPIQ